MKNINIFTAIVKSFEKIDKEGYIFPRAIINENSIFEITCIIDFENKKAIELETGKVFDLLIRDDSEKIINDENNPIKINYPYVTDYSLIDLEKYSFVYVLNMKALAKKTYENYNQNNLLKADSPKVKKIGKKNG